MQRTYYSSTAYIISTHAEHMQKLKEDAKKRLKERFTIQSLLTRLEDRKQKIKKELNTLFWSVVFLYYAFILLVGVLIS